MTRLEGMEGVAEPKRRAAEPVSTRLIILGTRPTTVQGGVAAALLGYLDALARVGIAHTFVPTHSAERKSGKLSLWLPALATTMRLIGEARAGGARVVVYAHAGELPSLVRKVGILWAARLAGAHTIIHVHAIQVDGYLCKPGLRGLVRCMFAVADQLWVLSPWWERRLAEDHVHSRVAVVPNPLPAALEATAAAQVAATEMRSSLQAVRTSLKVLVMTRLVRGKGVELLLEALALLPTDVSLVVAGDGDQRRALVEQAARLGLAERVRFAGWVAGDERWGLMRDADVFCLPSQLDSFGMGYIEAMAHGLPVVALGGGPVADVVPDGRVGVLVAAEPAAIATAITRMQDPAVRHAFAVEAPRWVLERFSAEVVGRAIRAKLEMLEP